MPTAGVTVVGTYPTHRRRGVLRALMRAQLDDVHERGEPLALLWASEETIYGRFGYGMASLCGLDRRPSRLQRLRASTRARGHARVSSTGRRRFGSSRASGTGCARRFPACSAAPVTGGSSASSSSSPASEGGPKRFVVLERDGQPEGYAIYRHKLKWERRRVSTSELVVVEAVALDGRPTAELWRYLFDIDWAVRITAGLLPIDHQLLQLLARPRLMKLRVWDGVWARLVDVGAALSARAYAADGAVVFDVVDGFCPWNEGRWRLAGGVAKRSKAPAQLRCDVAALGSVYLGGFTFEQLVRGGRVEELRRGAAARADAMFASSRAPWCPEIF